MADYASMWYAVTIRGPTPLSDRLRQGVGPKDNPVKDYIAEITAENLLLQVIVYYRV